MAKKGILALSSIAVIILWTVGTVMLLVAIAMIINQTTSATQEAVCRNSVALRAKAHISLDFAHVTEAYKKEKFTPLMCEPQNIGELKGTREEIKHQIAELSAKCWWMYLEGSVPNLFDSNVEDENSCGICYYFRIPETMDAGRINTEFVFFEELTKTRVSELRQKEEDPEIREFLKESMEEIEHHEIEHEGETILRPKNMISQQEFYNFMLAEQYDPGILYGGGTHNYIGNIHRFNSLLDLKQKERINLRNINTITPTQLQDYTYLIFEETQQKITEFGAQLYRSEGSILLVIVADEFTRNDRTDARRLIESLNMNSHPDRNDAMLITLDAGNGAIRIHAGNILERRIREHELTMVMERHFKDIRNVQELNQALSGLIDDLQNRMITQQTQDKTELRLPEGTYYQYLSNEQTTAPIIDNIEAGRTYAVTYKSLSDYQSWFSANREKLVGGVTIAAGAIIVGAGAIASATGIGAIAGAPMIKGGLALTIKGTAAVTIGAALTYSYFALTGTSFSDSLSALLGTLGTGKGDNAIFIFPASLTPEFCDEV